MRPHPSPVPISWSPRLCASWSAPRVSCAQGAMWCALGYLCCVLFCLLYLYVKYFKHTRKEFCFPSWLVFLSFSLQLGTWVQAGNENHEWAGAGTQIPVLAPDHGFSCASRPTAVAGIPHGCGKASVTQQTMGWNSRDSWSACCLRPGVGWASIPPPDSSPVTGRAQTLTHAVALGCVVSTAFITPDS